MNREEIKHERLVNHEILIDLINNNLVNNSFLVDGDIIISQYNQKLEELDRLERIIQREERIKIILDKNNEK